MSGRSNKECLEHGYCGECESPFMLFLKLLDHMAFFWPLVIFLVEILNFPGEGASVSNTLEYLMANTSNKLKNKFCAVVVNYCPFPKKKFCRN